MLKSIKLYYILFFFGIFFSNDIKFISIEYSLSTYWKLLPDLAKPFDDKDKFYKSLNSIDYYINEISDAPVSIGNSFSKNKKIKSIRKLKNFEHKIENGTNFIIFNSNICKF